MEEGYTFTPEEPELLVTDLKNMQYVPLEQPIRLYRGVKYCTFIDEGHVHIAIAHDISYYYNLLMHTCKDTWWKIKNRNNYDR